MELIVKYIATAVAIVGVAWAFSSCEATHYRADRDVECIKHHMHCDFRG